MKMNNELIGVKQTLEIIFPDAKSAPSFRTFNKWKSQGYFPTIKIGRRVFCNPDKVKEALEKRFTVE